MRYPTTVRPVHMYCSTTCHKVVAKTDAYLLIVQLPTFHGTFLPSPAFIYITRSDKTLLSRFYQFMSFYPNEIVAMIKPVLKKTLPLAIALSLTACSSSDTSTPDNNGYVSVGTITGFGSVFVNGVEFETDSATFDVDGVSGTQDDLAVGMKVGVKGTINDDGITGNATSIDFDEELQGPVSGITVGDGQTRSFTVLGTTVIIDSNETRFDDDSGVFDFDTIEDNDNVEISGYFDEAGTLHASRVELEDPDFDANSMVEVEGVITGLNGTSFMISSLNVDASAAALDDLPNGLVDGLKVEVKGSYDAATNTLTATKVEGEDDDLAEGDIEIEGIITRYVSDSDFDVDGHPVDASSADREPTSLTLYPGLHVEVEGNIIDGVLIAAEVKTREGENEVGALVSAVNVEANTFALEPVVGQPVINVRITTTTELDDEELDVEPFSITNIQPGNYIEVEGFINDAGELEAESVHRKNANDEDVFIKGIISAFDTVSVITTVTVLGISVAYDVDTNFEKDDSPSYTSTDFFSETSVINGSAEISVVDSDADGIADKIELEESDD